MWLSLEGEGKDQARGATRDIYTRAGFSAAISDLNSRTGLVTRAVVIHAGCKHPYCQANNRKPSDFTFRVGLIRSVSRQAPVENARRFRERIRISHPTRVACCHPSFPSRKRVRPATASRPGPVLLRVPTRQPMLALFRGPLARTFQVQEMPALTQGAVADDSPCSNASFASTCSTRR